MAELEMRRTTFLVGPEQIGIDLQRAIVILDCFFILVHRRVQPPAREQKLCVLGIFLNSLAEDRQRLVRLALPDRLRRLAYHVLRAKGNDGEEKSQQKTASEIHPM